MLIGLTAVSGSGKDTQANLFIKEKQGLHVKFAIGLRAWVYLKYNKDISRIGDKDYEQGEIQALLISESAEMLSNYGNMLWVGCLTSLLRYKLQPAQSVIISDVRQVHEVAIVYLLGGYLIRLVRESTSREHQPLDSLIPEYLIWSTIELKVEHRNKCIDLDFLPTRPDWNTIPFHILNEIEKPWNRLLYDLTDADAETLLRYSAYFLEKINDISI